MFIVFHVFGLCKGTFYTYLGSDLDQPLLPHFWPPAGAARRALPQDDQPCSPGRLGLSGSVGGGHRSLVALYEEQECYPWESKTIDTMV